MVLSVVCTLADDVLSPVAKFTLKILENSDLCQQLVDVGIRVIPGVPIGERTATSKGNHVWQLKRRLPRPTLTCRSPCVAASPPRRATWAAPRSGSTDGCSRGFRRLHRQWDPLDPTDGIAPDRIALVARGRARPRPHSRRFSTRLTRTPSRFRVCWRDRGRVRICRRADGFGFGLGPFLPIFCRQLLK